MSISYRSRLAQKLACLVVLSFLSSLSAQTWTGMNSGSWSDPGNWSALPVSSANTQLTFGATSNAVMANNLPGTFGTVSLNAMTFTSASPAYSLSGETIAFGTNSASVLPTITMNSNSSLAIADPVNLLTNLTIGGTGTGAVTLSGALNSSGSLTYSGAGTLTLGGVLTGFSGGATVNSGTLLLANNAGLGGSVTVNAGATFNTGGASNGPTHLATATLNGGILRVPGGGDYYVNQLTMTNGTVDLTGNTSSFLHFRGSVGVTINAGNSSWTGSTTGIETDQPLTINVAAGGGLGVGCVLSAGGASPNVTFSGSGNARLSNTGNTANLTSTGANLFSNDLSTNVGSGAFGTLGTGIVTLNGGILTYDGPTASSAKPLTINTVGYLSVANAGTNLTLNGAITESAAGSSLSVNGSNLAANPSTLTLAGSNTYSGATAVSGQLIVAISSFAAVGTSSTAPANLQLGGSFLGRGTLLYTGTDAAPSTNRGATVFGQYANGDGGAIGVQNAGTNLTWAGQITGSGSFIKTGAGTLTLTSMGNNFTGGAYVEGGTLALGASGPVLPAASNVTVQSGATLSLNGMYNQAASALGSVTLSGGTLAVPIGANDYYVNQLFMTNGTVDFTGSTDYFLHFVNANAGITINAGTSNWIGSGTSRIQNDTSSPLTITANAGATLNVGCILSADGTNANVSLSAAAAGAFRLSNPGNTANITVGPSAICYSNDLSTNLGTGAFGTLGTGTFTLNGGTLAYDGGTATSAKPLSCVGFGGSVVVATSAVNLTMAGVIAGNGELDLRGPGSVGGTSTLTLTGNNTFFNGLTIGAHIVLAIPTVADGGVASPMGAAPTDPAWLYLGFGGRGDLLLTGTAANYSTDRGAFVRGLYTSGGGGAIGVQNAGTTLTWSGQITEPGGQSSSFIKTGAGTLTMTNTTNNYSGGTYVEAGTLNIGVSGSVIPANTDVTVNAGATLQFGAVANGAAPIRTLTLNGGGYAVQANAAAGLYLNRLVTSTAGGTVDLGATGGGIVLFTGTGAGATINGNTSWTGRGTVVNSVNAVMSIVIAPGATVTSAVPLSNSFYTAPFQLSGGGTLYMVAAANNDAADYLVTQGRLRADDLSVTATLGSVLGAVDPGFLTLDGGILQYSGPTATSPMPITLTSAGGTIEVSNAATTLTYAGVVSGNGPLTKNGPGVLVLTNLANSLISSLIISGGRIDVSDDAQLAAYSPVVNAAGTLRYTASQTTSRTFNLNGGTLEVPAGVNLTLCGAAVNGGFLRGAGTFSVNAGTAVAGTSTFNSTTVNVTGPATFTNFSNAGTFTVAAGQTPPSFNGFINQGSGAITVGANSQVNGADFQTYGTLTLSPGSAAMPTQLINTGRSTLDFNGGSRTFISIPSHAGQFDAGIDLHGQNAVVAGGLFVNNGYVVDSTNTMPPVTLIADFGSLVKGAGFYQNSVQTINGGKFQSGNSPGSSTFGSFTFGPGGISNYVFAIDDATGAAGPSPDANGQVSGWGLVKTVQRVLGGTTTSGDFAWTATATNKLTVSLDTLVNPTTVGTDVAGPMADFDPTKPYAWLAASWAGNYSGPTDPVALNVSTAFDTTGFANPISGTFGWSLDATDRTLSLTYTPSAVPEPGTIFLAGLAGLGLAVKRKRR